MKRTGQRGKPGRSSQGKASATTRAILGRAAASSSAIRIQPKWAWHYRTLVGLRDRLMKDRGDQLAQSAERLEAHSMDMADSATDQFDHDLALSELSAEQDALYEVEEALKRILNRTYGLCEESGRPISAARLRAIPWTRFAKAAERRLEDKGGVKRPHLGALGSVRAAVAGDLEESETEEEKQVPLPQDESLQKFSLFPAAGKRPGVGRRREPNRRRRRKTHGRH